MSTKNKQAKHSPGPWKIDYAETASKWPVVYVDDENYEGGRHEVAEISDIVASNGNRRRKTLKKRWVPSEDADIAEANANLIVNAPAADLILQMIECAVARIDQHTREFCFDGLRYSCRDRDWTGLLDVIGWGKARRAVETAGWK